MTKHTSNDQTAEVRMWAKRQLGFELMLASLERRMAVRSEEVATSQGR